MYVCGDAYVDHPSFGMAIISRLLEAHGFRVGIIAQPDWRDPASVAVFGEPRLAFLVSAGNMDSMVNHYTVAKKRRKFDAYSPGGQMGLRPDHACVVYGNLIRRTYKKTPIILGGIEASLRRLAHYDYWSDSLKRSILLDSGADLISYGMGEHSIVEIAEALDSGLDVQDLTFIPGTVYRARSIEQCDKPVILPTFEQMQADKTEYARSFGMQYRQLNPFLSHPLVEEYPHGVYVVQNPPPLPLSTEEFDAVYELPYARAYHPSYEAAGGIPAIAEIKFSLTSNRGCLGECAFCALNFHQGRIIQTRSHESILEEASSMTHDPDFKGYIHDVGGPTANFRVPACQKQLSRGACVGRRCLSPEPCKNLRVTHKDYLKLLRKLRALPGVKKVFIRSGIRFDYALLDPDHTFIRELAEHHTSGQLRLAPEHVSDEVLRVMGKPPQRRLPALLQGVRAHEPRGRQGAVRRALPHEQPPGLHDEGGRRAGRVLPRPGLQPRAGAGLLPHAVDGLHLHLLHRARPAHHEARLLPHQPAREGHAARAHPVPQPQEPRARDRGAAQGRTRGPHRLRAEVPRAARGKRQERVRRRWTAGWVTGRGAAIRAAAAGAISQRPLRNPIGLVASRRYAPKKAASASRQGVRHTEESSTCMCSRTSCHLTV